MSSIPISSYGITGLISVGPCAALGTLAAHSSASSNESHSMT